MTASEQMFVFNTGAAWRLQGALARTDDGRWWLSHRALGEEHALCLAHDGAEVMHAGKRMRYTPVEQIICSLPTQRPALEHIVAKLTQEFGAQWGQV